MYILFLSRVPLIIIIIVVIYINIIKRVGKSRGSGCYEIQKTAVASRSNA